MNFQPSRIVDAREEAWEHNWETFWPFPSHALALFCLTLCGFGLVCNHPGLFFSLSPLALRSELEKNADANARASLCQSDTQQLPAFWCKKIFPIRFFLGDCESICFDVDCQYLLCGFIFLPPVPLWLAICAYMTSNHHARTTSCGSSVLCQLHGVEWAYVE